MLITKNSALLCITEASHYSGTYVQECTQVRPWVLQCGVIGLEQGFH